MSENQETVRVFGRYDLNEEEKREKSQELAETIRNLGLKQLEKKTIVKQFAADIEGLQETIEQLSGHIRDGYEMKPINCYRKKDYVRKRVMFVSVDTGDVVKTEAFTEADYQMGIADGVMA
jgi:hypothetical protein